MKKFCFVYILFIIICSVVFTGCGGGRGKTVVSTTNTSGATTGKALMDLEEAHSKGIITDKEYKKEKKKILKK